MKKSGKKIAKEQKGAKRRFGKKARDEHKIEPDDIPDEEQDQVQ